MVASGRPLTIQRRAPALAHIRLPYPARVVEVERHLDVAFGLFECDQSSADCFVKANHQNGHNAIIRQG